MFPLSARYRHDKLICLLGRCEWNQPPECIMCNSVMLLLFALVVLLLMSSYL